MVLCKIQMPHYNMDLSLKNAGYAANIRKFYNENLSPVVSVCRVSVTANMSSLPRNGCYHRTQHKFWYVTDRLHNAINWILRTGPWLRQLVACLSAQRPWYALRPFYMTFVVDRVALDSLCSEFFGSPLSVSFHRGSSYPGGWIIVWMQFRYMVSPHRHEQQEGKINNAFISYVWNS
jgi:hypothetical protein